MKLDSRLIESSLARGTVKGQCIATTFSTNVKMLQGKSCTDVSAAKRCFVIMESREGCYFLDSSFLIVPRVLVPLATFTWLQFCTRIAHTIFDFEGHFQAMAQFCK